MKASKAFLQRLSRRSEDNRAFEDDNETAYSMDIDNVDRAPWSEGVLSSQDILGRIFRQLSLNRPEGFSADGVCRYTCSNHGRVYYLTILDAKSRDAISGYDKYQSVKYPNPNILDVLKRVICLCEGMHLSVVLGGRRQGSCLWLLKCHII